MKTRLKLMDKQIQKRKKMKSKSTSKKATLLSDDAARANYLKKYKVNQIQAKNNNVL